jgi:hypothetical protein
MRVAVSLAAIQRSRKAFRVIGVKPPASCLP